MSGIDAVASAFGGRLLRLRSGGWCWSDGTPEPRVYDVPPPWDFRIQGGKVYVPVGAASEDDALTWCTRYPRGPDIDAGLAIRSRVGSDDHRVGGRGAYLVPCEDWDSHWSAVGPCFAVAERDRPEIERRARALGWRQ